MWFWVPATVLLLGFVGWAVLSGFPLRERKTPEYGRRTGPVIPEKSTTRGAPELIVEVREERPRKQEMARVPNERGADENEIGESEAIRILRRVISDRDYYDVPRDCLATRSRGYSNRGYTIEVYARNCGDRAEGLLGRWRVDALTRNVYVQKPNGKYLRP